MQAAASPFSFFPFLCYPALTPTVSANIRVLYFSVSSQIASHPYQKNRRCSASIRGENWHIIDGLLLWVYCETSLHLYLLYKINVMVVSRDSLEMFLFFLTTLPSLNSTQLFDRKIYLLTTPTVDLGDPSTAVLTRSWGFSLKG